jgi:hypothetical protein
LIWLTGIDLFSLDSQHEFHVGGICLAYKPAFGEVTLTILFLLGKDVALVGMLSLDLTASSEFETLLGTGISLHFWHLCSFLRRAKIMNLPKSGKREGKNSPKNAVFL